LATIVAWFHIGLLTDVNTNILPLLTCVSLHFNLFSTVTYKCQPFSTLRTWTWEYLL